MNTTACNTSDCRHPATQSIPLYMLRGWPEAWRDESNSRKVPACDFHAARAERMYARTADVELTAVSNRKDASASRADSFGFVHHMWARALVKEQKRQDTAFATRHTACDHVGTNAARVECDHAAALIYIPELPVHVGDVLRVTAGPRLGDYATVERLMTDGYGVAFADGHQTWIDASHVTR